MDSPDPPDPAPQAPPQADSAPVKGNSTARNVGAGIIGAIVLAAKYLFVFGKAFAFGWTFLLSLWIYVVFFGWRFAIVIILLLLAHELGHYFAFRSYGLPVRLPQFVPLLGAFTMGVAPDDLEHDAYIALAGPLTGLVLASMCYGIAQTLHDPFWLAVAYVSATLNLFNLLPFRPFDGGSVVGAVWKREHNDPRAATMTVAARVRVALAYVATVGFLLIVTFQSHVGSSGGASPW